MSRPASERLPVSSLVLLGVICLCDGFEFTAITQVLPSLRAAFGLGKARAGLLITLINLGAMAAWFIVRSADRFGRRTCLLLTVAGYALFSCCTGFAPGPAAFAVLQFLARMFLIAATGIAVIYVSEEASAAHRGLVIAILQSCFSLGAVVCAATVPALLLSRWGWRTVYFVGGLSALTLVPAKWVLPESRRFLQCPHRAVWTFLDIWRGPYRHRVLWMGMVWACAFACTQSTVMFWKEFAVGERGFSDARVGAAIAVAALGAMPLVFLSGSLLDGLGRRTGALAIFSIEIVSALGSFSLKGFWPLTCMLLLGIFGASAVQMVLNAYTAELFPTELRGDAYAWTNNLFGRLGFVISPILVGYLAHNHGWGMAVRLMAIGPVLSLIMLMLWAPETAAGELEITSRL